MDLTIFCKIKDNSFSLEKYRNNDIFLLGDIVEVKRYFFFKKKGTVIGIIKSRPSGFGVQALQVKINGKTYKYCPKKAKVLNRRQIFFNIPENQTYWKEKIKEDTYKVFENNDMNAINSGGYDFLDGLRVIQTDLPESLALDYFQRSYKRGTYVLDNKMIENSSIGLANDNAKIKVLRSFAYSKALLSNELDSIKLHQTANLIKKICSEVSSAYWWADDQDLYLSAIRVLIIADDLDKARDFIKSKRTFRMHLDQKKILRKLLRKTIDPKKDIKLKKDCYDYVEYTNYNLSDYSSFFSSEYTYIEWSAIYYKYFISPNFTIDWKYVFRSLKDFNTL